MANETSFSKSMMQRTRCAVACFLLLSVAVAIGCQDSAEPEAGEEARSPQGNVAANSSQDSSTSQERRFEFTYEVVITDLTPGKPTKVWIPKAQSGEHQTIKVIETQIPGEPKLETEAKYGNEYWYTEVTPDDSGEVAVKVVYDVQRSEVTPEKYAQQEASSAPAEYLAASAMVPIDGEQVEGVLGEIELADSSQANAKSFYSTVLERVDYKKPAGQPWGRGDTNWVCGSGFGNCTDFHSLFISLCRNQKIPAYFEIGFPIGNESSGEVGGYHCWAFFLSEGKWHPVDISEADKNPELADYFLGQLKSDRVAFSKGRDLVLGDQQQADPLNFFVYPHVEVDGNTHTSFTKKFAYQSKD